MKYNCPYQLSTILPSAAGLTLLLVTWWLGDGGLFLFIVFAAGIIGGEYFYRFLSDRFFNPYLGMVLSPLLLLYYSSVNDFRIRLACFLMLIYILFLAWRRANSRIKISLAATAPWRIWLLSFLVFSLAAVVFYARGIQLSGDEPHYVMIAQSLVEDNDFDLKNNLENKTYLKYLPVTIRFHGAVQNGRYRSFHLPGISFLLIPCFYLFNLLGRLIPANLYFRLCAALINAFFALGLFQVLKTALPDKDNSRLFLFFLLTFPLVFQAIHLYPELPAATLMIFAWLSLRQKRNPLLTGLLLALIPWFHLKYALPALVLALYVIITEWRREGKSAERLKRLTLFLAMPAFSGALLAFYSKILYGSANPSCISPERNFFAIPLGLKIETLLSFFLDQRDGLLVYAPVFLLLFLAFKKEIRKGIGDFTLLAAIFISYVLFHAFTTVRGSYSPAARPTLFVIWIMAVFLVAYYRRAAAEVHQTLFRLLAGLTVFATVWLFYYPLFLYQPVTREISQRASSLLQFLSSEALDFAAFFPSFLKKSNAAYFPNWIWLGLLAMAFGLYYAKIAWPAIARAARMLFPALGVALLFFVCFFPHVWLQKRYTAAGLSFFSNSKNFTFRKEAAAFKILAGQDYDLFIDVDGSAAANVNLRFSNTENIFLKVKNGKYTLLSENQAPESRLDLSLKALRKFSLGGKNLVHLGLETAAARKNAFFWLKFE